MKNEPQNKTDEAQNKIDEMKIIREVQLRADALYEEAKELGDHAARTFGEKHRAQITGLEKIAESTFKLSDVFDYIKRQTARHEHWQHEGFGKTLLEKLEIKLASEQRTISAGLGINDKTEPGRQERRRIQLLLIRQFIRQMAVEYEFQVYFGKGARRNGTQ